MADAQVRARLAALGIEALSIEEGLDLLGRALASPEVDVSVVRLDPEAWGRSSGAPRVRAYLGSADEPVEQPRTGLTSDAVADVAAIELARVLGRADASGIDRGRGFFDLGLDSMTAVAYARALEDRLGIPVGPTAAFDHGDLASLTAWLSGRLTPAPAAAVTTPAGRSDEPVAIVGMACRFPGSDDPDALWALLTTGGGAIRRVPADRWDADALYDPEPGRTGRMYVREGGFLEQVDGFDAAWFGISPREAAVLDPQQRLLLEVGVEAVEDAGLPLDGLVRSRTGVFVGVGPSDYGRRFDARVDPADPYVGTGNVSSFAAGRLAYALGVQGPAIGLDTACSSSLVTLHLACQSLRAGECDLALAGGVHLMLSPETTIQLSQLQALSPTARCHTFDASADGYARGEGCGLVVLKRLSEARRDGDRVLAVVLASGVNHDGPSAGLTVPSGSAQQALLRDVLGRSGLAPADVGLIEAHGTGTRLGDPIEMGAIKAVYGDRPGDRPLRITSVKTHLGHLELAAGVAGVIATVQSLRRGVVAPLLGFKQPNPAMDLSFPVRLPARAEAWDGPRRAAVSSFGLSGTNAHVILEAPPSEEPSAPSPRSHHLFVLSGRSEGAVRGLAARLAARGGDDHADLAWTLATGRSREAWRAHVVAASSEEAGARLRQIAEGGSVTLGGGPAPLVWMFTGQGAQSPGMGAELYAAWPVYRDVIDRCDARIRALRGESLIDVIASGDRVHDTAWTQPALFAVEAALAALWRSLGVQPDAVIGHSVGEIAAAWFAGVFELEDAVALVAERGRLMSELPRDGGMAQVALREGDVRARLTRYAGLLDVAAVNAPDETVISGDTAALDALLAALAEEGVRARPLVVSHAFHSPKMDPMLDAFEAAVRRVALRPPSTPILSNLTARPESALLTEAVYWRRHVREPVRFADGLRAAPTGARFLEIGPHPVLSAFAARVRSDAACVPSLRRDRPAGEALADAVGRLWREGVDVDWRAWDAGARRA
ncbi:MAG TPA: beta-ketoacyl synthase N-terminal-like domain-containing protein, partial [Myxococcota bacterium]|nr:beta-ketoacyl synthase N-terminal-like domain-containing protein [Myxococcota bacterium]